jgi:hypothetical protein
MRWALVVLCHCFSGVAVLCLLLLARQLFSPLAGLLFCDWPGDYCIRAILRVHNSACSARARVVFM